MSRSALTDAERQVSQRLRPAQRTRRCGGGTLEQAEGTGAYSLICYVVLF